VPRRIQLEHQIIGVFCRDVVGNVEIARNVGHDAFWRAIRRPEWREGNVRPNRSAIWIILHRHKAGSSAGIGCSRHYHISRRIERHPAHCLLRLANSPIACRPEHIAIRIVFERCVIPIRSWGIDAARHVDPIRGRQQRDRVRRVSPGVLSHPELIPGRPVLHQFEPRRWSPQIIRRTKDVDVSRSIQRQQSGKVTGIPNSAIVRGCPQQSPIRRIFECDKVIGVGRQRCACHISVAGVVGLDSPRTVAPV
jgi:hypothetical protein